MALTATFEANFSKFFDAVDKAQVAIRSFEEGAARVGPRLNAMVDSFSGRRIVEQAALMARAVEEIGGVSKLTEKELARVGATAQEAAAKLRALGQDVPANIQKIADASEKSKVSLGGMLEVLGPLGPMIAGAFTVGAVVSFGKEILADADALQKMSDQTGISVEELQRMKAIASESGNTIEELTGAVSQLQKRLGEGDKSAVSALKALGIEIDSFLKSSPDQQFYAIARAIQQIEDPIERAKLGAELFGKSFATIMPSLRADIDGIRESTTVMSDETIKSLDRLGDAWDRLWTRVKVFVANNLIAQQTLEQEHTAMVARLRRINEIAAGALPTLPGAPAGPALPEPMRVPGLPSPEMIVYTDALLKNLMETNRERLAQIAKQTALDKAATEAQEKFRASVRNTTSDAIGAKNSLGAIGILMQDNTAHARAMAQAWEELDNEAKGLNADGTLVSRTFTDWAEKLQDVGQTGGAAQKEIEKLHAGGTTWAEAFITDLDRVAGVLDNIDAAFAQTMSVGVRAASAISKAWKNADLTTGQKVTATITTGTAALAAMTKSTVLAAAATGASIGALAGPWGAAIGAGVGAIVGAFKDAEKKINPVRESFVRTAGGLDQLNLAAYKAGMSLDQLLKARDEAALKAAIDGLNAGFAQQQQTMELLVDTAARYGFTLEQLGPALQRQELDKQAQQLYQDFNVLNSAGIDSVLITEKMADSVNKYLAQVQVMGAEVPTAMRPMLEAMVKAGTLTDANGEKIEDLEDSGISFSMTMSEGFKALITSVDKLATVISRTLGTAIADTTYRINQIPRNVPVTVTYTEVNRPTTTTAPVESYQEGTDGFRNFGAGTPVMLHGWEAVVPRDQASTPGGPLEPGGGDATVVINAQGAFFDSPDALLRLADKVNEALSMKRGLSHRRRAA
jgi:hypothetical protein